MASDAARLQSPSVVQHCVAIGVFPTCVAELEVTHAPRTGSSESPFKTNADIGWFGGEAGGEGGVGGAGEEGGAASHRTAASLIKQVS